MTILADTPTATPADLAALLDRLAAPPRAAGAVIWDADTDTEEALDALVTVIDDTVLRRMLRFETDAGAVLKIEVANRRLRRIVALPDTGGRIGEESLIDRALDTAEDLAALRSAFDAFCGRARRIQFAAQPPLGAAPLSDFGISAAAMRAAWGLASCSTSGPGFEAALALAHARASDLVLREAGTEVETRGPRAAALPSAAELLAAHAAGQDPVIMMLRGADDLLLVAQAGEDELVALLPGGALDEITQAWRP